MPERPGAPILIVEDNAETRHVLQRVLGVKGYASVTAESGADALRYLRGGGPACLMILDLRLQDIGGHELHRQLKADPQLAGIPVIVFSAATPEEELPDVVAYVRKGADPDELLDLIARACRER